jgi:hypothetical protein
MVFLILGALLIINNNNLAMYKNENYEKFSELYAGWFGDLYENFHSVIGYVIKLDWFP